MINAVPAPRSPGTVADAEHQPDHRARPSMTMRICSKGDAEDHVSSQTRDAKQTARPMMTTPHAALVVRARRRDATALGRRRTRRRARPRPSRVVTVLFLSQR